MFQVIWTLLLNTELNVSFDDYLVHFFQPFQLEVFCLAAQLIQAFDLKGKQYI